MDGPLWACRNPGAPSAPLHDSLFPLPPLLWKERQVGSSKDSRRRARRRARVWVESNAAIDALNSLYGCAGAGPRGGPRLEPAPAQASAQRRVAAAVSGSLPEVFPSGPEALRELLGGTGEYEQCDSTFVPYEPDKVSLPSGLRAPVPLMEVAGAELAGELDLASMLADDDVVTYRETYEPAGLYLDANLRRSVAAYAAFVRRLFDIGILGFSTRARGEVQPFFVRKKGSRQRLVLDCRRVNQKFRKPLVPDMGSGECLSRLESPPGSPVSVGTADIRNLPVRHPAGVGRVLRVLKGEVERRPVLGCHHGHLGEPDHRR